MERTAQPSTEPVHALAAEGAETQPAPLEQTMLGTELSPAEAFVPPSRKAFPGVAADETVETSAIESKLDLAKPPSTKSGVERTMTRFFLFVLVLAAVAGAFYAGRKYKGIIPYLDQSQASIADPSPTPVLPVSAPQGNDASLLKFEKGRRSVDTDPNAWLATQQPAELSRQGVAAPLDSQDPEFLYLYGRASLLAGKTEEAVKAFEASIARADLNPSPANATVRKEAAFGLAAAALKSETAKPAALRHFDEATRPAQPSPSGSPLSSP